MKHIKLFLFRFALVVFLFSIVFPFSFPAYAQENQAEESPIQSERVEGQSEVGKNLLIELFINADCTACPKAAFCLEDLTWAYEPGRVILLESHIWGDGYDIPETNTRYNWYTGESKKGTPDAFFNGLSQRIQGLCCSCGDIEENYSAYQEIIERQLEQISPLEITAEQEIGSKKIIVQGKIINKSRSLLQNLIIGGMLYYEGDESELFYLVKDIFDQQDICQIAPMEERSFSFIPPLDLSGLDKEEIGKYRTVIFIQNRLTKEILQSFLIQ